MVAAHRNFRQAARKFRVYCGFVNSYSGNEKRNQMHDDKLDKIDRSGVSNVSLQSRVWPCRSEIEINEQLCYRRRTARRAMSVKIVSLSGPTTNSQQIEVMELDGYS